MWGMNTLMSTTPSSYAAHVLLRLVQQLTFEHVCSELENIPSSHAHALFKCSACKQYLQHAGLISCLLNQQYFVFKSFWWETHSDM